ncbi:signal peptidase II [Pseudomonadota bacterium]
MNDKPSASTRRAFPPYPWLWLLLSALVIMLDWETKRWASESLQLYRPQEIFSWLNMTLAHNYGAAFSFLSDAGGWQRWMFSVLAGVVSLVLIVWLIRLPRSEWLTGVSLSLIIGGAIGNLIDRIRLGYVVDFVDVFFRDWHYPAFNVADSAITVGVVLLLLDGIVLSYFREKSA